MRGSAKRLTMKELVLLLKKAPAPDARLAADVRRGIKMAKPQRAPWGR